jgi:hypothetical protein
MVFISISHVLIAMASAVANAETAGDADVSVNQVTAEPAVEQAVEIVEPEPAPEWEPGATHYDWIQLTSGEWLKGELKSMYNKSVEFDSDKLGLLTIDWADVRFLKTYRDGQVNIAGIAPVSGRLKISGSTVTVTRNSYTRIFNRDELISLTPSGERESDLWSIKYTLALNFKAGNTDQIDYNAKLNAKRRTAKTRFIMDYVGNISKTNNLDGSLTETVNNHRINSNYDVYATRYFYYTPLGGEIYRDPFQNIERRIAIGVGIGYTIIDNGPLEWTVGGGPAYIKTRYYSVEQGASNETDSPAFVFNTSFDAEVTDSLDFIVKYNAQVAEADAGGYSHHLVTTLESEITGSLDFDISLYWDRNTHPVKDDQGVQPEEDDYRLAIGVTYTY